MGKWWKNLAVFWIGYFLGSEGRAHALHGEVHFVEKFIYFINGKAQLRWGLGGFCFLI